MTQFLRPQPPAAAAARALLARVGAAPLHLNLVKSGLYCSDGIASNHLINAYCKSADLESARRVLDELPLKNAVSWTCLITGFANAGSPAEAFGAFRRMLADDCRPTPFTFGSLLRASRDTTGNTLQLVGQVHGMAMKSPCAGDVAVCNALISAYRACPGSSSLAKKVFSGTPNKSEITWNAVLSMCAERQDAAEAFSWFTAMRRNGFGGNEYTFGSLIGATHAAPSGLGALRQVFALVMKNGLSGNIYIGSALVSAFCRLGMIGVAKQLFLGMEVKNAVSMNGLMVGLIRQHLVEEAVDVFRQTRDHGLATADTFIVLLSAAAELSTQPGREVHGFVLRTGMADAKTAVSNSLVNMYARTGAMDMACRVFAQMTARDQCSWNTLISGLDQAGRCEDALGSYRAMRRCGFMPSNYAVISTLSSCSASGNIAAAEQVQCDAVKAGLDSDVSVSNALVAVYGSCGAMAESWKVFRCMQEHDRVSWNSIIGAMAAAQAPPAESVGAFSGMMRSGFVPDRVTFVSLLSALSVLSVLDLGKQLHSSALKHGISDDTAIDNALMSCYAKSGDMGSCEQLFAGMSSRRDGVSWNSLIAGYIHNGELQKAMDAVWMMLHSGQKLDCFTFATVLSACAAAAALEHGMTMHASSIRSCLRPDIVVESALVDMYSKCGRIGYAAKVFTAMDVKNDFSWNSMISGYARHGLAGKALELFRDMQRAEQRPCHVTFVGVLSACSHAGLVDEGLKYFRMMEAAYGLMPRIEQYCCVVDLLGRADRLGELEEFVRTMPIKPNNFIWRSVLAACRRSKNGMKAGLGELAARMLLELEPENGVNYVLASNFHAAIRSWEGVAEARAKMRGAAARKEAGNSWVTLPDGVHTFVAGDRSHPESKEIYSELKLLKEKLRDAGYVPQTEFALYDLDPEQKEELLSHHSEKLAVAFVLARTRGSSRPIRIMKNIRVCGDCHLAFRYISKIVGRKIVLRDHSRFHHFEDGQCSCRDYW